MSRKTILITIILAAALLFVLFLWRGGHWLVVETPLEEADAIVMMRGSTPEREREVARIFNDGLANQIVFANFNTHSTRLLDSLELDLTLGAANTITTLQHLGVPGNHITVLAGANSSTRGETIAVREYLENHDHIKTIIVVSSPPHMRRARMIFRRELRKLDRDVELIMRPSPYSDFQASRWYRHRESARSVVFEYVKMLASAW